MLRMLRALLIASVLITTGCTVTTVPGAYYSAPAPVYVSPSYRYHYVPLTPSYRYRYVPHSPHSYRHRY